MKQTFITKSLLPFVTFIISQSVVSQFKVISQKLFDVNVIQISRCDTYGECDSSDEKAPRKWLMNNWALVWAIYKEQPFDDINKGICEDYKDTILCRRCDVEGCRYGRLGQTCTFARITHLFDNGAAVFLDFMSLWDVVSVVKMDTS
ncbi:uncharacterized protein LOC143249008 isoform X10 [Tachypleus tridentatus]|uniref:uncharacterized protein LOC143249008 isoform X10 n=1 Tax=Tachypleus tridentatus TaxID=6853 RepID=UPI003FCF2A1E